MTQEKNVIKNVCHTIIEVVEQKDKSKYQGPNKKSYLYFRIRFSHECAFILSNE